MLSKKTGEDLWISRRVVSGGGEGTGRGECVHINSTLFALGLQYILILFKVLSFNCLVIIAKF